MLGAYDNFVSFLIGSSIIGSFISIMYIGSGFAEWRQSGNWDVNEFNDFEMSIMAVLILIGLANVLAQNLVAVTGSYWMNVLVGILFGLMLSSMGRFGYGFPIKVFGFTESNEWTVHMYAALLYGLVVFGIVNGGVSWFTIHNN